MEEPEQTVYFPVFNTIDKEGKDVKPSQVIEEGQYKFREEINVSKEEIYKWLTEMEELFPQLPALDALQTYMRPLCIESLIDPAIYRSMALESAIEAYGIGALELPIDLFTTFESIRSYNNLYDLLASYKSEQELKTKTK